MADQSQGHHGAQSLQVIISGGVAGAIASLASTRVEWRRLRNEEEQKSAYFEQELFRARLDVYKVLSASLSEFAEALRVAIEPLRLQGTWTNADRLALDSALSDRRASVAQLVVEASLFFGPSMEQPLNDWSGALNRIIGRFSPTTGTATDADELGPELASVARIQAQWQIIHGMRRTCILARWTLSSLASWSNAAGHIGQAHRAGAGS